MPKGFGGKGGKGRGGRGFRLGAALVAGAAVAVAVACTRRRGCTCCSCARPTHNVVVIRGQRVPAITAVAVVEAAPAPFVIRASPTQSAPLAAKALPGPYATKCDPPKWKKDNACFHCDSKFSLFGTGRHHCRKCGNSCCDNCSASTARLPQMGYNKPVRVCISCAPCASQSQMPGDAIYRDQSTGKLYSHDSVTGLSKWVEVDSQVAPTQA